MKNILMALLALVMVSGCEMMERHAWRMRNDPYYRQQMEQNSQTFKEAGELIGRGASGIGGQRVNQSPLPPVQYNQVSGRKCLGCAGTGSRFNYFGQRVHCTLCSGTGLE